MWYHHDVIAASKPKSEGRGSTGARALAEEEWAISMNNKSRKNGISKLIGASFINILVV
jgi:hypothetical protein